MLEIYKEIGAVNGPGWRPLPERTALETSIVEMSTLQESKAQFMAQPQRIFDFPFAGSDPMKYLKRELTNQRRDELEEEKIESAKKF